MKGNIRNKYNIKNFVELKIAVKKEWIGITSDTLMNAYDGIPKRL